MFERSNDPIYITPLLQEPKRLAECQFADHIKGIYVDLVWEAHYSTGLNIQYCNQAEISQTFPWATNSSSRRNNV